jgi:hypothetical protein
MRRLWCTSCFVGERLTLSDALSLLQLLESILLLPSLSHPPSRSSSTSATLFPYLPILYHGRRIRVEVLID